MPDYLTDTHISPIHQTIFLLFHFTFALICVLVSDSLVYYHGKHVCWQIVSGEIAERRFYASATFFFEQHTIADAHAPNQFLRIQIILICIFFWLGRTRNHLHGIDDWASPFQTIWIVAHYSVCITFSSSSDSCVLFRKHTLLSFHMHLAFASNQCDFDRWYLNKRKSNQSMYSITICGQLSKAHNNSNRLFSINISRIDSIKWVNKWRKQKESAKPNCTLCVGIWEILMQIEKSREMRKKALLSEVIRFCIAFVCSCNSNLCYWNVFAQSSTVFKIWTKIKIICRVIVGHGWHCTVWHIVRHGVYASIMTITIMCCGNTGNDSDNDNDQHCLDIYRSLTKQMGC